MLRVQLDDRALFLARWQKLLLDVLAPDAVAKDPRRAEARRLVEAWGGRASIDSVGYRVVRAFRERVRGFVLDPLLAPRAREGREAPPPGHGAERALGRAGVGARDGASRAPPRPAVPELGCAPPRPRPTPFSRS